MGDRFVVVPVGALAGAAVGDPGPASSSGGSAATGDEEAAETSGDQRQVLPILDYKREPNKYGKYGSPNAAFRFSKVSRRLWVVAFLLSHVEGNPSQIFGSFDFSICKTQNGVQKPVPV